MQNHTIPSFPTFPPFPMPPGLGIPTLPSFPVPPGLGEFIDFAVPLALQLKKTDKNGEFQLVRKTQDGKGWVWKALEEDNETFTTIGDPRNEEELFEGFQSFVETGNPTRFTGMQGIDGGGAGAVLKELSLKNPDNFANFDPDSFKPPAFVDDDEALGVKTLPQELGVDKDGNVVVIDDAPYDIKEAESKKAESDEKAMPFSEFGDSKSEVAAKDWIKEYLVGMNPGAAPVDWKQRAQRVDQATGKPFIPGYVAAYWFNLELKARVDEISDQRASIQETVNKDEIAWGNANITIKTSAQGQVLQAKHLANVKQLNALNSMLEAAEGSFKTSRQLLGSTFTAATAFDFSNVDKILQSYSRQEVDKTKTTGSYNPSPTEVKPGGETDVKLGGETEVKHGIHTVGGSDGVDPAAEAAAAAALAAANEEAAAKAALAAANKEAAAGASPTGSITLYKNGESSVFNGTFDDFAGYMAEGWSTTDPAADALGSKLPNLNGDQTVVPAPSMAGGFNQAYKSGLDGANAFINRVENSGFDDNQVRNMAFEQQFPGTVYGRMGLEGQLAGGTSTEQLSGLARAGLNDYMYRQLEPGYAQALANQSRAGVIGSEVTAPGVGGFDPATSPYPTFEAFARSQLAGAGENAPPSMMQSGGWNPQNVINTIQDTNNVNDPYRQALLGYLGNIEGTAGLKNSRFMNILNSPTLSQISPLYRQAAAERMTSSLQNRMIQQPERNLLSFYTGNKADTITPQMDMDAFNAFAANGLT